MKDPILFIIIFLLVSFISVGFLESPQEQFPCKADMERAFFDGHRAAMNGDIIIQEIYTDVWVFTETMWIDDIPMSNDTIFDY